MKNFTRKTVFLFLISYSMFLICLSSCASRKTGCPATQSGMGAEKVLAGEKVKKQKFKIKGMQ